MKTIRDTRVEDATHLFSVKDRHFSQHEIDTFLEQEFGADHQIIEPEMFAAALLHIGLTADVCDTRWVKYVYSTDPRVETKLLLGVIRYDDTAGMNKGDVFLVRFKD
jgi:hypothetical protein